MTKQERVKEYNSLNPSYNITAIKRMTPSEIEGRTVYAPKSLDELYTSYSDAKRDSYDEILSTYKPQQILGLNGSSHAYSVLLVADNGDMLLITRDNNYLVEEVA